MWFEDGDKPEAGKRYTLTVADCCVSAQITGTCTGFNEKEEPLLSDVVVENWDGGSFSVAD